MKPGLRKPGSGGCWFCFVRNADLTFDGEFDTYVHAQCIKRELVFNPSNEEAHIMSYLLGQDEDDFKPIIVQEHNGKIIQVKGTK